MRQGVFCRTGAMTVNRHIQAKRGELAKLARRHHVRFLYIFGSGADDRFDAQTSDLDFLVEFPPLDPARYAECYLGLLLGLEELFGRSVDLVTNRSVRNPYFREALDATRKRVYAAGSEEASV